MAATLPLITHSVQTIGIAPPQCPENQARARALQVRERARVERTQGGKFVDTTSSDQARRAIRSSVSFVPSRSRWRIGRPVQLVLDWTVHASTGFHLPCSAEWKQTYSALCLRHQRALQRCSQERLQDVRMRPRLEPGKPQRVAQTKIFPVGASVVCPCAIPRCLLPHLLRASAPILEKRCPMSLRGAFHVPDPTPAQLLNATMTNGNRRAKRVARRLSHIRARANAVFVAAGAGPLAWRFAVA